MRNIVLTLKEQEKYNVIKKLLETNGNKKRAAKKLRISVRQINRLIAGYKEFGKQFFVHGNRGRKPVNALSFELKNHIEDLYTTKYFDCTYTLFTELLAEKKIFFFLLLKLVIYLDKDIFFLLKLIKLLRKTLKNYFFNRKNKLIQKKKSLIFKQILLL